MNLYKAIRFEDIKVGDHLNCTDINREIVGTVIYKEPRSADIIFLLEVERYYPDACGVWPVLDAEDLAGMNPAPVAIGKNYYWLIPSAPFDYVLLSSGERPEVAVAIERTVLSCVECKNSNQYAEPNRPDGSFLCYCCRTTYGWKYR